MRGEGGRGRGRDCCLFFVFFRRWGSSYGSAQPVLSRAGAYLTSCSAASAALASGDRLRRGTCAFTTHHGASNARPSVQMRVPRVPIVELANVRSLRRRGLLTLHFAARVDVLTRLVSHVEIWPYFFLAVVLFSSHAFTAVLILLIPLSSMTWPVIVGVCSSLASCASTSRRRWQ